MIKNVLLCLTFFCTGASAQFIASYSFAAVTSSSGIVDPSPVPVVTGVNMGTFIATGLSPNSNAAGRFAFSGWPLGAQDAIDDFTQFTGSLSGLKYYEIALKVVPGNTLDLTSVSFAVRRSGTGPRNYSLRCSKNNFSSDLTASTGTNIKLSVLPLNIFFWKYDSISTSSDQKGSMVSQDPMLQNISDSVTFRFYAWNAESSNGSFSIDNVSFSGLVKDSTSYNPVSILDVQQEDVISVYCYDGLLKINSDELPIKMQLFDMTQKLVGVSEKKKELNVTGVKEGVYNLLVELSSKKIYRRIVINARE